MAPNDAESKKKNDEEAKAFLEAEEGAIFEANDDDIISGRGAAVNLNPGNRKFRDLCFKRKPEFDAASHAAKRRIATEIVVQTKAANGRFLKRKVDKGPWYEMSDEKALLKACQVMRDYQRPDRIASRGQSSGNGRKRQRIGGEPAAEQPVPPVPAEPLAPIVENPFGVHDHDVLSGRGAFVNGHVGNEYFRKLCVERKTQFDAGNYSEKRNLAAEVVTNIRNQDPGGRFLKRVQASEGAAEGEAIEWEELSDDRAVHKACQVMRDIARPDRAEGRRSRKGAKKQEVTVAEAAAMEAKDSMTILAETTAEASAVEEAVAATEEALDKALDAAVPSKEDVTAEAQV